MPDGDKIHIGLSERGGGAELNLSIGDVVGVIGHLCEEREVVKRWWVSWGRSEMSLLSLVMVIVRLRGLKMNQCQSHRAHM